MLKGFRDFLLRGNVIDLAVGVVIGIAFTGIVTSITHGIIEPLINTVSAGNPQGLGVTIVPGKPSTYLDFASLITAVIDFVVVAAVVYFVFVLPMNKVRERREHREDPESGEPNEVELLTEIRDLLRADRRSEAG